MIHFSIKKDIMPERVKERKEDGLDNSAVLACFQLSKRYFMNAAPIILCEIFCFLCFLIFFIFTVIKSGISLFKLIWIITINIITVFQMVLDSAWHISFFFIKVRE